VAEFGTSILSLEDAKSEIASIQYLRAAYLQIVEQLLSGLVKQGDKVSLWKHSKNRDEDAKQCRFIIEEVGHTRISLATRVLNIDKLGSKGSQVEARNLQREKKIVQRAGTQSRRIRRRSWG